MSLDIKVDGLDGVQKELKRLQNAYWREFNAAMREEAEEIGRESQNEVPIDTGELHDSLEIKAVRRGRNQWQLIQYRARHAVPVHERTELRHPNGGKAKFLQDPFMRAVPNMAARIAQRIAEKLG